MNEIEMPLVYVLADMEKEGVRAEKAELEAYGAQLTGRISELETSIYENAGETFNINLRNSWVLFCLKNCRCQTVRKQKPDTLPLRMSWNVWLRTIRSYQKFWSIVSLPN